MHPLFVSLAHLVLTGVSVFLVAKLLPGVKAKSLGAAISFAFVAGVLNAIVWGFLASPGHTANAEGFGLGTLIINGLVFLLSAKIVGEVEISGCVMAIIASVGVTFVNAAMHPFFGKWAP